MKKVYPIAIKIDEAGNPVFTNAEGYIIPFDNKYNLSFGVHRTPEKTWSVTELSTGLRVNNAGCTTKKEAIEELLVDGYIDRIATAVKSKSLDKYREGLKAYISTKMI